MKPGPPTWTPTFSGGANDPRPHPHNRRGGGAGGLPVLPDSEMQKGGLVNRCMNCGKWYSEHDDGRCADGEIFTDEGIESDDREEDLE